MSKQVMFQHRLLRLILALGLPLIISVTLVRAFAEEPVGWRDPATGVTYPNTTISTIHDDLSYVLALAAGFSITDAKTVQVWDQLVDSEALPGSVVSYTNGGGAYYPPPNPGDVCANPIHTKDIWPRTQDMVISTSITSRYGQYSPFFHFPHQSGPLAQRDLGALRNWATGITTQLVAYEAYAWGGPLDLTVFQAKCLYTRTAVITTNIVAGSLPAFATYLHSLGDSYSHLICIQAMDALGYPWASHSQTVTVVPPCYYPVNDPSNIDAHGEEFGMGSITDSMRTDAAVRAIYSELITRSLQHEGRYMPIGLSTLLTLSLSETFSFSDTLYQFVHNWNYDQPVERRAWADQIAAAVLAERVPLRRAYLPITLK